ncbi:MULTISPECIES: MFS transporter [Microbacterium]|uniref:Antiseptic resistance protein n=3 Tax=Microbacterium ginsengisoli TaxID=400772 RepID=A0A0F0M0U4_9MICO|nr:MULTISPECIES: MFS transporter [Microbacterium]MCK9914276.1 MFS transporter [Microbacteriaceae bacterium K1510]KJL43252.1 Antiseptic resistance protein [Microbacterium ginsengisoli]KQR93206.1 MFS transporter [Microbacterium sp. Leaf351]KQS05393.1 MFS transporter [Microbacterium sp. Leaf347]ODU73578.1 MAG: MFS transporter [Microbacterium sp. SCN 71-21]
MTDPRNRPVKTSLFDREHPHYKWLALSNTTLGMLMATINASIVIISLPAIFEGIGLNPLEAGNVSYLLWMLMGYMLVSAVLVVTFGRLGDMYGRVRIYNLGFVVFSVASIALSLDPFSGGPGATWLILWRLVQGVGGAMLFANSTAILTDAFPAHRRGMALGVNQVAAIAGSFIGLIIGGLLAVIDWRAVFLVSVPIGIIGTIWSYVSLKEVGARNPGKLDWPGNITFALGLSALLTAITYGIQPYGDSTTGWTNPWVLGGIVGGILLLVAFVFIELRSSAPMFDMRLFRIRAFAMANLAGLLAAIGRGGLQFMLIIWLQGIWLPLHGYAYADTPLWAGIYMLPITIGFLIAGPISGTLSDRFGARLFATVGLLIVSVTFVLLLLIPVNFEYWQFAIITGLSGLGSGMFGAPNRSAIMNSVPASERGAASGMAGTVLNAGTSLSIGLFFSLLIAGLATSLPDAMKSGLTAHGVPADAAAQIAQLPPVGSVFAAFLGYNPIQTLLGPTGVLDHLPASDVAALTGNQFFPQLISEPFHDGLVIVFLAAAIMSLIGAIASLVRGRHYVHAATAPVPVVSSAS